LQAVIQRDWPGQRPQAVLQQGMSQKPEETKKVKTD
jgi:hypothetical protein